MFAAVGTSRPSGLAREDLEWSIATEGFRVASAGAPEATEFAGSFKRAGLVPPCASPFWVRANTRRVRVFCWDKSLTSGSPRAAGEARTH
jgi:hypothetical protein